MTITMRSCQTCGIRPPSGQPRAATVQGMRSIFRILRARKLVFTSPTFRIHVPAQAMAVPPAVDVVAVRDALDSLSPARAVLTALLACQPTPAESPRGAAP